MLDFIAFGSLFGTVLLLLVVGVDLWRTAKASFPRMGILFNRHSLWIGCHYSDYTRRYCVNLLPCITLWFTKHGGQVPYRYNEDYYEN